MQKAGNNNTIVACSTALGGAIALIRLSGPKALDIVQKHFNKSLAKLSERTSQFGLFRVDQEILDEVVLTVFKAPNTYTGEDMVEISCHGSSYVVSECLRNLIKSGARHAQAGEFTMRAFLNGKMDLSRAEAVADVIASESEASHRLAMDQMRGGFAKEIVKIREELINFASLIELELDFGEEDVEFANREELKSRVGEVVERLEQLCNGFKTGQVIKNGIPVVICGKPNAGKSTLLNALLKDDKAIVSDIPGTTRDYIEDRMVMNGIEFRFIDTAGIRESEDAIEIAGVKRSREQIKKSKIVLYLFDATAENPEDLKLAVEEIKTLTEGGSTLVLCGTKIDLLDQEKSQENMTEWSHNFSDVVWISAKTGSGLKELESGMTNWAEQHLNMGQSVIVTNVRHYEALQQALHALKKVSSDLEGGQTGDFIAMDIRHAMMHLSEILGEVTSDDLLGNIFGKFCIGK